MLILCCVLLLTPKPFKPLVTIVSVELKYNGRPNDPNMYLWDGFKPMFKGMSVLMVLQSLDQAI